MKAVLGAIFLAAAAFPASAQSDDPVSAEPLPAPVAEPSVSEAPAAASPEDDPDSDEYANRLNAGQQIRQDFTVTRTINGQVVETQTRTLTFSRGDPVRPTEAGGSPVEALIAAFNSELLTRTEAFEEARLDFVVADLDRDGKLTADEFAGLVEVWRTSAVRETPVSGPEQARDRQHRAFLDEIAPEGAQLAAENRARAKFAYMTGAAPTLSREDYIREYLLDFDSMDGDGDGMLRGEELMMFRALNRGETLTR